MNDGFLPLTKRPRRNRQSPAVRALLQETSLDPRHFVAPFFVIEGSHKKEPLPSLPLHFRFSIDELLKELERYLKLNIQAINLFCVIDPAEKDPLGSKAYEKDNLLQRAIRSIKKEFPHCFVCADIALDPFTSHGHDGLINGTTIINDPTCNALAEMALRAGEAGCDMVSPSDMMDGRVGHIRKTLDKNGLFHIGIISYAAKYASSFYGPFRDVLQSSPSFGDKKSYQLNPANRKEALREIALDEEEGADMLLIKPALTNLDIIKEASTLTHLPIGAYQVSGEYGALKAAGKEGLLDDKAALYESLLSIKRAGSDFIFTYAAKEISELLLS